MTTQLSQMKMQIGNKSLPFGFMKLKYEIQTFNCDPFSFSSIVLEVV